MHEGHKKFIHYFVCIILIRGMLKVLCRRDDNIKTIVDEAQCENVYWLGYAEDSCHSHFPISMAMNLHRFP